MTDNPITITLQDGMLLHATTPHFDSIIPMDSSLETGGQGAGYRPLTMLLVGLGGCMAMDVMSILRKKHQEFNHFEIKFTDVQQAEEYPKIYTHIHMHVTASGPKITEEALARSLELAYTKYCPVNAMLSKAAQITYSYEVLPVIETAL